MTTEQLIRKALHLFPDVTISQSCFMTDDGEFGPMEWEVYCVSYGWKDVAKLRKRGSVLSKVLKEVIRIGETRDKKKVRK